MITGSRSLQGISVSQIQAILDKSSPYADIIEGVLADPALPRIAGLVRQIKAMEKPSTKPATTASTKPPSTSSTTGIGLWRVVKPLEIYIWTRHNKAATIAILAGVVLVPVGLGFVLGRVTKR